MRVEKCVIPPDSLLNGYLPADYTDSFVCSFGTNPDLTADDIQVSFWTVMPRWVSGLMKLRGILVRPFGLTSGKGPGLHKVEQCLRSGGECGFFTVLGKSPVETAILLRDKHLDAYMSVYLGSDGALKTITVITLVKYHNALGRAYFFIIRPFHKIIVPSMLKGIINTKQA